MSFTLSEFFSLASLPLISMGIWAEQGMQLLLIVFVKCIRAGLLQCFTVDVHLTHFTAIGQTY